MLDSILRNFVNWKTSLGGILMMMTGVCGLLGVTLGADTPMAPTTAIGMITGGFGLTFAKDHNVTGGQIPNA